jgi:hypothetical protein
MSIVLASPMGAAQTAPPFSGVPRTPSPSPGGCKTVLVVGDSIADGIDDVLEEALTSAPYRYCATVVPVAISGSNTCQWSMFGWFDAFVAATEPDVIVAHFLPNEGFVLGDGSLGPSCPLYADASWLSVNLANADAMEANAAARDIPLYWMIPAPSYVSDAATCYPPDQSVGSARLQEWATTIAGRFAREIDLRPVFGAPDGATWHDVFDLGDGVTLPLRMPAPDCVHFTPLGSRYAADTVRAAIAEEWDTPSASSTSRTVGASSRAANGGRRRDV